MKCSGEPRLAALLTHPVQYYSPWLAQLARSIDLTVFYAYRQTSAGQAAAGFGVDFEWDIPLLEGYRHRFLENISRRPGLDHFHGCDTPEIANILKQERFDALMLFGWNKKSLVQAWVGALRARTPVMVRLDSQLEAQKGRVKRIVKQLVYPVLLAGSAHYLSPGVRTDQYLLQHGVPLQRIHRLPHMIDVDRFAQKAKQAREGSNVERRRSTWGAKDGHIVFLFVGKLIEKKRPDLLLKAFLSAKLDGTCMVFVGDGPLRKKLEEAAGKNPQVHFEGFVNQAELPEYYAASDCLVLPSTGEETWGLVVNEAQATGLPAIVSNEAGSCPELIDEGRTGWVLSQPEVNALAELLRVASQVRLVNSPDILAKSADASFAAGVQRTVEIMNRIRAR